MSVSARNLFIIFGILLIINIVALWVMIFRQSQKLSMQSAQLQTQQAKTGNSDIAVLPTTTSAIPLATPAPSAPVATNDIQSLTQRVTSLETAVAQLSQKTTTKTTVISSSPSLKETIVYLGTGSTSNRDWTDMPSALATIDTKNYGTIREVHFEAGLSIIGGEAHVRLINKTTGAIFYNSELSNNTAVAMWQSSPTLYLPSGAAEYSVQMKSTSGEVANMEGARLRIKVK